MVKDLSTLRKIVVEIREIEQHLKSELNLSLNEALILCQIQEGVKETRKISQEIGVSTSRFSRLLDSLEKKALILRSLSPLNRRTLNLEITTLGLQKLEQLHCTPTALSASLKERVTFSTTGDK